MRMVEFRVFFTNRGVVLITFIETSVHYLQLSIKVTSQISHSFKPKIAPQNLFPGDLSPDVPDGATRDSNARNLPLQPWEVDKVC